MARLFLTSWLLTLAAGWALRLLNLAHLKANGSVVPAEFAGAIDPAILDKTSRYTWEKGWAGLAQSFFDSGVLLAFVFGGGLGVYDGWVAGVAGAGPLAGVLFFVGLLLATSILGVPFDLYDTFRTESKYGFNTTTPILWLTDLFKSLIISGCLFGLLSWGALTLVGWAPDAWWLWVWGLFVSVSVFLLFLSPYVIEPLFFKFEPVQKEGLEEEVRRVMCAAGLTAGRVFQVDASRRSRHANAYFTGIGKVKRVVLFDTLIAQMEPSEVVAVLAHEIGHWKGRHVLRRLATTAMIALGGLYLAFRLVRWGGVPGLVGLSAASLPGQCVVLWLLATVGGFFLTPLLSFLGRRDERAADRYACGAIGNPRALASALVKLSRENLANLHPHPLFSGFYYSHPPIGERVRALNDLTLLSDAQKGQ